MALSSSDMGILPCTPCTFSLYVPHSHLNVIFQTCAMTMKFFCWINQNTFIGVVVSFIHGNGSVMLNKMFDFFNCIHSKDLVLFMHRFPMIVS